MPRARYGGALKWAIKAAWLSSADEHRVGAALFNGRAPLSIGWNCLKTHPKSSTRYHAQHAEFNCLIGLRKEQVSGATIFVARLTRGRNLGISKPCDHCQELLRAAGVREVWFLISTNEIERMRL